MCKCITVTVSIILFNNRPDDGAPWIQVDFKKYKLLSGVITMGSSELNQWVTKYKVYSSIDGKSFRPYSDTVGSNVPKLFSGNTDAENPERHLFNRNITARYIRIYPTVFKGTVPAMRINILGCSPDAPYHPTPVPLINGKPTAAPNGSVVGLPTLEPVTGPIVEPTKNPEGQFTFRNSFNMGW